MIADAALALTDDGGLGALSMRKLGAALGVEAMSIYHYVENKEDLLDAVLDRLYGRIELPWDLPDRDWEQAVRGGLLAFHRVLVDHPAALQLFASRPVPSEEACSVLVWGHNRFRAVGLDEDDAMDAFHTAVSFILGHMAREVGVNRHDRQADPGWWDDVEDPGVARFLGHTASCDHQATLRAGIDTVIAGLRTHYDLP